MATFGERLQAALELRDMSQRELGRRAGVSVAHVSRSASGESVPTVDIAARLAQTLDVSLDWLVDLPRREPGALTPAEEEWLRMYREMSEPGREVAMGMARALARAAGGI